LKQFGVHRNPSAASDDTPYVIVLQSHFLDSLESVVAAPIQRGKQQLLAQIDLPITVDSELLVVAVAELAAIDRTRLGPVVFDAADHEDAIRRALDRIFTGF